jgi:hypothetical protein
MQAATYFGPPLPIARKAQHRGLRADMHIFFEQCAWLIKDQDQ